MKKYEVDKAVRAELDALGATLERETKHFVYRIPGFGNVVISRSPSCKRATREIMKNLKCARKTLEEQGLIAKKF